MYDTRAAVSARVLFLLLLLLLQPVPVFSGIMGEGSD
jgi:hypothetical protein